MSEAQGGKFINGFASGALSSVAASLWQGDATHQGASGALRLKGDAGTILFGAIAGGAGADFTGGNFWQGAVTGGIVAYFNHALHDGGDGPGDPKKAKPKQPKYKVIKSTSQAKKHYNSGTGASVVLSKETRLALRKTSEYKRVLNRLKTGVANNYSGSFDVDMTGEFFHVGDTNVDYITSFDNNGCATTVFTEFVRDGFWDPNFVSETILGGLGFESYQPDGMGPNLETSGSAPYRYIPSTYIVSYPTYSPINLRFK